MISLFPALKFLTSLEVLVIQNCEKLDLTEGEDNQEGFPTSLRALCFIELPQLVVMPEWIKRSIKTLQVLLINNCPNLIAFPEWLPNLESLLRLDISSCPKLLSLPQAKPCLIALRSFRIARCSELSRRCLPEIGEDWHMISHASEIYLDYVRIK